MKNFVYFLIVCTSFLTLGCKTYKKNKSSHVQSNTRKSKSPKSNFKFERSPTLSAVLDKAARENKPVFVDFYTDWCTPCKMMDQDVFTDKSLADFYTKHFISYKVNCEKGNGVNLAAIFNIIHYPTLLFLDEKGNVLVKHERAAYHSKMQELADEAIHIFNNR